MGSNPTPRILFKTVFHVFFFKFRNDVIGKYLKSFDITIILGLEIAGSSSGQGCGALDKLFETWLRRTPVTGVRIPARLFL